MNRWVAAIALVGAWACGFIQGQAEPQANVEQLSEALRRSHAEMLEARSAQSVAEWRVKSLLAISGGSAGYSP
jgi:hypothetical protein